MYLDRPAADLVRLGRLALLRDLRDDGLDMEDQAGAQVVLGIAVVQKGCINDDILFHRTIWFLLLLDDPPAALALDGGLQQHRLPCSSPTACAPSTAGGRQPPRPARPPP